MISATEILLKIKSAFSAEGVDAAEKKTQQLGDTADKSGKKAQGAFEALKTKIQGVTQVTELFNKVLSGLGFLTIFTTIIGWITSIRDRINEAKKAAQELEFKKIDDATKTALDDTLKKYEAILRVIKGIGEEQQRQREIEAMRTGNTRALEDINLDKEEQAAIDAIPTGSPTYASERSVVSARFSKRRTNLASQRRTDDLRSQGNQIMQDRESVQGQEAAARAAAEEIAKKIAKILAQAEIESARKILKAVAITGTVGKGLTYDIPDPDAPARAQKLREQVYGTEEKPGLIAQQKKQLEIADAAKKKSDYLKEKALATYQSANVSAIRSDVENTVAGRQVSEAERARQEATQAIISQGDAEKERELKRQQDAAIDRQVEAAEKAMQQRAAEQAAEEQQLAGRAQEAAGAASSYAGQVKERREQLRFSKAQGQFKGDVEADPQLQYLIKMMLDNQQKSNALHREQISEAARHQEELNGLKRAYDVMKSQKHNAYMDGGAE